MKFCRYCGRQLADDAAFCDACGTRSAAKPAQPVGSGETAKSQTVACTMQQPPAPNQPVAAGNPEKKKRGKKTLLIVLPIVLVLIVAAVAVLAGLQLNSWKDPAVKTCSNYVLYEKNNNLYYMNLSDRKPICVMEDLLLGAEWLLQDGALQISKDGKLAVYEKHSNDTSSLYYRDSANPEEEGMIDKGKYSIGNIAVSDDGKTVTYYAFDHDEDGATNYGIYQFDGKETKKIISLKSYISQMRVSGDGKRVFYSIGVGDGDWYGLSEEEVPDHNGYFWWEAGKGSEKICSVSYRCEPSLDVSTACYFPDRRARRRLASVILDDYGTLYRKHFGEEAEVLAQNVSHVYWQNSLDSQRAWKEIYSEDYSVVYYTANGELLYRADENGRVKQVDEVEYLYFKRGKSEWPEITFEETAKEIDVVYGNLYMNGKLVAKNVTCSDRVSDYTPVYLPESGSLVYFKEAIVDWAGNHWDMSATMMLYNGKRSVKIAEDVYDCHYLPDGSILYWCLSDYKYKLYWFDGETTHLLDQDIQEIIPVWELKYYNPTAQ